MDLQGEGWKVFAGSCLDRLRELPDESVDAVVTDPPYGLSNTDPAHVSQALVRWVSGERDFIPEGKGFMGKAWDAFVPPPAVWDECLRVLKPGGHVLAFAGSRTFDLMALSIRLAGFEIRDSVAWLYGSGFPKSLDVSKAIDKAAGVEREVLTETVSDLFGERKQQKKKLDIASTHDRITMGNNWRGEIVETTATTPEAQKWQGWGTALKPAFEPVVVARKPLIGTVAENVLAHGTGALNIDGTRIGTEGGCAGAGAGAGARVFSDGLNGTFAKPVDGLGRWPSNVMLDEFTAGLVDEQSGVRPAGAFPKSANVASGEHYEGGWKAVQNEQRITMDTGGASRFFYIAKASKRDRNEGLDELEAKQCGQTYGLTNGTNNPQQTPHKHEPKQNFHPTVKPTDLMRQLVRLVTPPGGLVLDPFTGSGSTGKAAILEGFEFVGVELTEDYLPIIEGRLSHAVKMRADALAEAEAQEAETLF